MHRIFKRLFYPIRLKRFLAWATYDAVTILIAYSAAFSVRAATAPLRPFFESLIFIFGYAAVVIFFLYLANVYHRIWSRTGVHGLRNLIGGVIGATLSILVLDMIFFPTNRPIPYSVVLVGNALSIIGMTIGRYRTRLVSGLRWRWKAVWDQEFPGTNYVRVLIVGAGEAGQAVALRFKNVASHPQEYKIIGFVDDDSLKQGLMIEGYRVLGTRELIPQLVQSHQIDLIVVTLYNIPVKEFQNILSYCEQTSARIKIAPDVLAMLKTNPAPLLRDVEIEDFIGRKAIGRYEGVDLSSVTNKTILVTGAAGSIGAELSRQLLEYDPDTLILLDNNESGLHDLVTELTTPHDAPRLVSVLADITHQPSLARIFQQHTPQLIFHAAAYKHVPILEEYPDEAMRVNIGGTLQLAELAQDYGVEQFVLISTDKAVNPQSIMGASKRICELLMASFSQQPGNQTLFTSVRFGNVLGSRGSVVPTFHKQIDNGGPVTVTDPEMTRYFMAIPEAVNLVIHAACLTCGNDLFMLQMGEVVKIVELAERMIRMRGLRPGVDIQIEYTGMRPGEKLHEELYSLSELTENTIHPNIVKLIDDHLSFDANLFLQQVRQLLTKGLNANQDALTQLLKLTKTTVNEVTIVYDAAD